MTKARIGIDPDLEKSGYCLLKHQPFLGQQIIELSCEPFFILINKIKLAHEEYGNNLMVCIECGYLNKIANYHQSKSMAIASTIGKKVGENHAISKLLVEFCRFNNINFKEVKPQSKKWTSDWFKKITKYDKRTNQEERDAVRTAWV